MLHQQRSGNLARLKYLVAVPIGAALLCASTLGFSKTYGWIDLAPHTTIEQNTQTQQPSKKVTEVVKPPKPKVDQVKFPPRVMALVPVGFKPQKTYVNAKGYKIEEGIFSRGGRTSYLVIITDPSGKKIDASNKQFVAYKGMIEDEKRALALYGYKFPDVKVSKILPPEPPKPKVDQVRFPPPIVAPDVPADFKPEKSYINEKGYKIEEGPFMANGKNYYVAIINEDATGKKLGTYYKGFNDRRINPILQNYGYKFPDVKVSSFLPPPEPPKPVKLKRDQVKFPPPIVKPDKSAPKPKVDQIKFPPPVPKRGLVAPPKPKVDRIVFPPPIVKPDTISSDKQTSTKDDVPSSQKKGLSFSNKTPLIILDGVEFIPNEK